MIAAEIAASVVECAIMTEFLLRSLGLKNEKGKVLKAAACFLLLFLNIIICPVLTDTEIVSVATMLIIELAFSTIFLKGKTYTKVFVVFINCIAIMLINTAVLMLLGKVLSINIAELVSGNGAARLWVLYHKAI